MGSKRGLTGHCDDSGWDWQLLAGLQQNQSLSLSLVS